MKVLVIYAHPAQRHSRANKALERAAKEVRDVSFIDLYALYPRMDIDIEVEQQRLLEHDAIVFQFPLMWYSTPPIIKEYQDLVLEYGFSYGEHGDALKDKLWLMAVTAGAPQSSYGLDGHNIFELRQLLAPLEATARLCKMQFVAPYVLFEALRKDAADAIEAHVEGYRVLLEALRTDQFDLEGGLKQSLMFSHTIPVLSKGVRA